MNSAMAAWMGTLGPRSRRARARVAGRMRAGGRTAKARRSPGAMVLLKVPQ